MVTDNSRMRLSVHNETTLSEDRPLRDSKLKDSWKGLRATDGKCLGAAGEAGVEAGENRVGKTKRSAET